MSLKEGQPILNNIEAIPPKKQWGTVTMEGMLFKDGQARSFQVPFTQDELVDLGSARFSSLGLISKAWHADDHSARKFAISQGVPWGYILENRANALEKIRKSEEKATKMLREGNLSEFTRGSLEIIKARLSRFSPSQQEKK